MYVPLMNYMQAAFQRQTKMQAARRLCRASLAALQKTEAMAVR
jgi:hypothetical protein